MNFLLSFEFFCIDKGAWCWLYFLPNGLWSPPARVCCHHSQLFHSLQRHPTEQVQLDCKVRKYRRPCADFNKPKTFLLRVLFLLEHQHLHLYNGPQKSLLKLKIFKKYDKTKVQVLFTVPLQTTACSLELNIQNQTRFGTARKQTFSSFFLRRPFW